MEAKNLKSKVAKNLWGQNWVKWKKRKVDEKNTADCALMIYNLGFFNII